LSKQGYFFFRPDYPSIRPELEISHPPVPLRFVDFLHIGKTPHATVHLGEDM
jgi:hypothetical protein